MRERELLGKFKADAVRIFDESRNRIGFLEQKCQQVTVAHVSAAQPDDLGWDAAREGELVEIHVLGHDGQAILLRVLPCPGAVKMRGREVKLWLD